MTVPLLGPIRHAVAECQRADLSLSVLLEAETHSRGTYHRVLEALRRQGFQICEFGGPNGRLAAQATADGVVFHLKGPYPPYESLDDDGFLTTDTNVFPLEKP